MSGAASKNGTDWLSAQMSMQAGQYFYVLPVALGLGIGGFFCIHDDLAPFFAVIALCAAMIIVIFCMLQGMRIAAIAISLLALLPSLGFVAAQYQTHHVYTPMIVEDIGPVIVQGRVENIEVLKLDYDARIILSDLTIEDVSPEDTPRLVRLRLRKEAGIQIGDRISVLAELMPLSEPVIPGGYDFRRHSFFEGIGAVGFIYKDVRILERSEAGWIDFFGIENIRHTIERAAYAVLPESAAAIFSALTVGKRGGISDEDNEAMRDSGLAHLLSISGLHLTMACGAVFFLSRAFMALFPAFALYHPIKKYAALLAIMAGIFYMLLAGASVPAQRSMIMSGLIFVAIIFDRSPFSLRLVTIAALVVLLFDPASLLSASFQMSFAAVTGLIVFYDALRERMSRWYRNAGWFRQVAIYLAGIIMTSVVASFSTALFGLYHFQNFSGYGGVLANMAAIPLTGFVIMPAAAIAMILMPFGWEYWPLWLAGAGIEAITDIAHYVAAMDGASFKVKAFSFYSFMAFVATLLALAIIRGWMKLLALIPACIGVFLLAGERSPDLLVSGSHKLVAFRDASGQIWVNSLRGDKFSREVWERSWGADQDTAKNWKEGPGACDDSGCRFEVGGRRFSYVTDPSVLAAECAWADVIVSRESSAARCGAIVIDRLDTWKSGAHAIEFGPASLNIETAASQRQNRPWSLRLPERHSSDSGASD